MEIPDPTLCQRRSVPARQHVWVMMQGSVFRPIVNRSGGKELTAGLVSRRLGPVGNPYVILARHPRSKSVRLSRRSQPWVKGHAAYVAVDASGTFSETCAEFKNHVPYHCRRCG
jgi:hypothetical protein